MSWFVVTVGPVMVCLYLIVRISMAMPGLCRFSEGVRARKPAYPCCGCESLVLTMSYIRRGGNFASMHMYMDNQCIHIIRIWTLSSLSLATGSQNFL